jgi:LmbE family N-acetylglucosaminyl deacetylase
MMQESEIIPFHTSPPAGERALILAPHPDDETLGCGGAVRLLVRSGKRVKVVFLTSGDKGDPQHPLSRVRQKISAAGTKANTPGRGMPTGISDESHLTEYASMREKEAVSALNVLGVSDYEFLRFPDRELNRYSDSVLESMLNIAEEYMPDSLYSSSPVELNPDHRATALIAREVQRRNMPGVTDKKRQVTLVFYEVTTPLRPNALVDITTVQTIKEQALNEYKSQMKPIDFLSHIVSLNTVRALTVDARYAEAFWVATLPLSDDDIRGWLSYEKRL